MYKRIVVPLDGSKLAEEVLTHVRRVGERARQRDHPHPRHNLPIVRIPVGRSERGLVAADES